MTDEQDAKREALRTYNREYMREWSKKRAAEMTPEEREQRRAYMREYMNTRNAAMSPEEREEFNAVKREQVRLRRSNATPEQLEKMRADASERTRARRAEKPEVVKEENKQYSERRRQKDTSPEYRATRLAANKRFYTALRQTALVRYSGSVPSCACCAETHTEFLAIDHIGGGGSQHRKTMAASSIYTWLKRQGYPDGYRVLCHNCNFAIRFGDPCPHEREKIVPFSRTQGGCS